MAAIVEQCMDTPWQHQHEVAARQQLQGGDVAVGARGDLAAAALASQPRVHQVGVAGVERGREDEAAPAGLVQFQALVARLGTILYAEQLVAEQGERL